VANTLNLFRNGASLLANTFGVGFIGWLDRRETVGRKFERDFNFSGTGIRPESPTLVTINSGPVEYRKSRALCDRHRRDAPGFGVDVANQQTFAFRSLSAWECRISRTWCVDGEALSLVGQN
jgi:hypothetical protein